MLLKLHNIIFLINIIYNNFAQSKLNIFLDGAEVHRLLGLKSEIFYIRNGTVNENALNRVLIIPPTLNIIHFTWEGLDSTYPILYKKYIKLSNEKVILPLKTNMSESGIIPSSKETVAIELICSEHRDDEETILEFSLDLKMNRHIDNYTRITIRRKKLCPLDLQKISNEISHPSVEVESLNYSQLKIFYIVLCLGCSLITMLVICFLAYIVTNRKDNRRDRLNSEQQMQLRSAESENAPFILSGSTVKTGTSTSSNISHNSMKKSNTYIQLDTRSLDLHDRISEITIERKRIRLQKVELEGTFGRVFNGTYTKDDGTEENVIVKTVMDFACPTQISLLLREGLTMYRLKHKNIMSVIGISIEDHVEPFVIYLKEGYTNLKKFLQKCKFCPEGIGHSLTTQEVVQIALQIISGIQYMHRKKILHKDLATRNCSIDGSLNVKVADNALSRDLFPNDYHCLGDNENRPVKWLSFESLVYKTFSTASDVWSFGVTLWELTTLAQQPYAEVDPFEIEHYLKDGYRLSQPINCPDELFAVMAYCWAMSPDERPTFFQLLTCLQDFHDQLNRYV